MPSNSPFLLRENYHQRTETGQRLKAHTYPFTLEHIHWDAADIPALRHHAKQVIALAEELLEMMGDE
jgi:hypothetical protein